VFILQQNLELFDAYQRQLATCDTAIEAHLARLAATAATPPTPLPPPRRRKKTYQNEPRFDVRTPLHQLTGADLSQIDGIGPYNALRLLSEIETGMSRWPTYKHFTSWLTLAPHNQISGGWLLRSRTQPSANRAAQPVRCGSFDGINASWLTSGRYIATSSDCPKTHKWTSGRPIRLRGSSVEKH
jgi:hypothetical protein